MLRVLGRTQAFRNSLTRIRGYRPVRGFASIVNDAEVEIELTEDQMEAIRKAEEKMHSKELMQ